MTLIRRVRPPAPKLHDFVLYAGRFTGIVDTIRNVPSRVYYVTAWNGRGQIPLYLSADRYIAEAHELSVIERPKPVLIRRALRG